MEAGGPSRSPRAHCEPTDEGFGRRLALGSNIQRARARSGASRPPARGPLRLARPRRAQPPRPRRPAQTRVSRGGPAWRAFRARCQTAEALAAASPAEVLRAWAGLGYNRRALALQRLAVTVVERHGGRLPDDLAALLALPGIGPYTARAILAIAHGNPVGAVGTNVRRGLGRAFAAHGSRWDAGEPLRARELQAMADRLVPANRPADWTAALMDIGASLCRPRRPDCGACPLAGECRYALTGITERAADPRPRRVAEAPAAYETTSRWLRGRIVERLRALSDGEGTEIG